MVSNVGREEFSARVQKNGSVLLMITIAPDSIEEIQLLKGYELYFDSEQPATARVIFRPSEI